MRTRFDEQLAELNNKIIEMGVYIENSITRTIKALENHDVELAQGVIDETYIVAEMEKEIEALCLKLLLNQHPVARDLRQISTALKIITDMERIGDQAGDICELCIFLADQKYIKKLEHIPQMAAATIKMVSESIDAFVRNDAELARSVIDYDDVVDDLYKLIKKDLIRLIHEDVANGEQAFDLMQIAKFFERIGDHAVNIAEWVIFSITGRHKDKQVL